MTLSNTSTRRTNSTSLAEEAYIRVKRMIVTLELRPDASIRDADLQEKLGIGRMPLRDALHRLANEGMVHIYPRRAIVVAKLGVQDIGQIFEARVILEGSAAALTADRLTDQEVEEIIGLQSTFQTSQATGAVEDFLETDQIFHHAVARYSGNHYLQECIDHLETLNLWLWHIYFDARGVQRSDLFAHEEIFSALIARDAEEAERAMRDHVLAAKDQILQGF